MFSSLWKGGTTTTTQMFANSLLFANGLQLRTFAACLYRPENLPGYIHRLTNISASIKPQQNPYKLI